MTAPQSADATLERIVTQRAIPVLRCRSAEDAVATARACARAGMRVIELTRSTPHVDEAFAELRGDGLVLGLGTVTSAEQVAAAAAAGARFVASFGAPPGMVAAARAEGLLAIPGALTPTEVLRCVDDGATAVKLFPGRLIEPAYLGDLRAVMPDLRVFVTGGVPVSPDAIGSWLAAGALAVGLGGALGTAADDGPAEVEARARAALEHAGRAG